MILARGTYRRHLRIGLTFHRPARLNNLQSRADAMLGGFSILGSAGPVSGSCWSAGTALFPLASGYAADKTQVDLI